MLRGKSIFAIATTQIWIWSSAVDRAPHVFLEGQILVMEFGSGYASRERISHSGFERILCDFGLAFLFGGKDCTKLC
jgi:hypothetical protein